MKQGISMPSARTLLRLPSPSHPAVETIKRVLKIDVDPVLLRSEPASSAVSNECLENVASKVNKDGGQPIYGWRIAEPLPGVMIEAEFHAVWQSDTGELLDVSPQELRHVLFLPDPNRLYEARQLDNLRIALVRDLLVERYIKNAKLRFKKINAGSLATSDHYFNTPEIIAISRKYIDLQNQIISKYYPEVSRG